MPFSLSVILQTTYFSYHLYNALCTYVTLHLEGVIITNRDIKYSSLTTDPQRSINCHRSDLPYSSASIRILTHDPIYRSKVSRPINAEIENAPYPQKGKAYEFQTW